MTDRDATGVSRAWSGMTSVMPRGHVTLSRPADADTPAAVVTRTLYAFSARVLGTLNTISVLLTFVTGTLVASSITVTPP